MPKLYCTVTSTSNILAVNINTSHNSSVSIATIEVGSVPSLSLGDYVEIDMGYTTSHAKLFSGYVKSIDYSVPSKTWTIAANDALIQAMDYYIVSTNPETPLTYRNITAEALVESLMTLSGLTDFTYDPTYFTFGINNEFEVNQVSCYDYSRTVCDLLTWSLWADEDGLVHFENRKPIVMSGSEPQPGWVDDGAAKGNLVSYTWEDAKTLDITEHKDEKDLRNRVVVYGSGDIYAEAKDDATPYFKWKTAALAASDLIDSQSLADDTAAYNLHLFNRITESLRGTVLGDVNLKARNVVTVNSTRLGISSTLYYIFSAEHSWSAGGYKTVLDLRK